MYVRRGFDDRRRSAFRRRFQIDDETMTVAAARCDGESLRRSVCREIDHHTQRTVALLAETDLLDVPLVRRERPRSVASVGGRDIDVDTNGIAPRKRRLFDLTRQLGFSAAGHGYLLVHHAF